MSKNEVFMDTKVFTDIVEEIREAASNCVLSEEPLKMADCLDGFSAGRELHALLKEVYKSNDLYRNEASESLPRALLTLRDSMIAVDEEVSKSLKVEKCSANNLSAASASIPFGNRYAQKQLQKSIEKGKEKARKNYDAEKDYNAKKNASKTLAQLQALNTPDANLPDYTEEIDKWLAEQEKYFDKVDMVTSINPLPNGKQIGKIPFSAAFINKVKTGGDMDVKQPIKWRQAFPDIPFPEGDHSYFIYHGQVMDPATLGNVTYSYIGAKYYTDFELYSGGAAVQTKRRSWSDLPYMYTLPDYGDMHEDHESIGLGIKWRKEGFPSDN